MSALDAHIWMLSESVQSNKSACNDSVTRFPLTIARKCLLVKFKLNVRHVLLWLLVKYMKGEHRKRSNTTNMKLIQTRFDLARSWAIRSREISFTYATWMIRTYILYTVIIFGLYSYYVEITGDFLFSFT